MEDFKDYVNELFVGKKLELNKCNIKDIKINEKILLEKIKEVIK